MNKTGKSIMIQGTGSDVGKSIITSAFCRIFLQDGHSVAPFKAQNMALNSFVTHTGGEIGRAQAVQAHAAGILPSVDMNPVLMKPCSDKKAQIIVRGKAIGNKSAIGYTNFKKRLIGTVTGSFKRLRDGYDIVVIEGAGSPAEINLKEHDIVNMAMAKIAGSPVILVGDIDRGGVLASLVGTMELLDESERKMVKGIIINKFRGDISLLGNAVEFLEKRTGVKVLGILPYIKDIKIAEEDSIPVKAKRNASLNKEGMITIAVIGLPHISNFTDFDPLENEPDVDLRYVRSAEEIKSTVDAVIIPGTKNTIMDFLWLRKTGFADKLLALKDTPAVIIGICGGYQMLGTEIKDAKSIESRKKNIKALGLLPVMTELKQDKRLSQVTAKEIRTGITVKGYEIHHGITKRCGPCKPVFTFIAPAQKDDGASNAGGTVWGSYIHGIFDNDSFRRSFINKIRAEKGLAPLSKTTAHDPGRAFDALADVVRKNVDIDAVYKILQKGLS